MTARLFHLRLVTTRRNDDPITGTRFVPTRRSSSFRECVWSNGAHTHKNRCLLFQVLEVFTLATSKLHLRNRLSSTYQIASDCAIFLVNLLKMLKAMLEETCSGLSILRFRTKRARILEQTNRLDLFREMTREINALLLHESSSYEKRSNQCHDDYYSHF